MNVTPASGRFFAYDSLGELASGSDKHWTTALPGNCLNIVFGYNCQASGSGWTTDNSTSYSYDLAGNRTSQGGTYGSANRLTGFNGCTYGADADGNVTSRTCTGAPSLSAAFTWSAEGQLTSITNQGSTYNLKYSATNRLVRIDLGVTPQAHYLWEGDNMLGELNGTATSKLSEYSYYPGLDHLHALIQGSTAYFAHQDGLGNVIALTDVAKTIQRTYSYDDWGALTGGTDTHGFAGLDRARWKGAFETSMGGGDLYYSRNRWYEPQTGRFLSEDPLGLEGGLNPYLYANNDPIGGADPTGLCSETETEVNVGSGWPICVPIGHRLGDVTTTGQSGGSNRFPMRDLPWGTQNPCVNPGMASILGDQPDPPICMPIDGGWGGNWQPGGGGGPGPAHRPASPSAQPQGAPSPDEAQARCDQAGDRAAESFVVDAGLLFGYRAAMAGLRELTVAGPYIARSASARVAAMVGANKFITGSLAAPLGYILELDKGSRGVDAVPLVGSVHKLAVEASVCFSP
jgi:RHS repeat-associated protein